MSGMRWCGIAVLAVLSILFTLVGCQTTENGSMVNENGMGGMKGSVMKDPGMVSINTVPLGAKVYIDGVYKGDTPMTIKLEEGKDYKLELKEEEHGYETQTRTINSKTGSVNVNMPKKR